MPMAPSLDNPYRYIVVGSGAGGGTLAARLAEPAAGCCSSKPVEMHTS